MKRNKKLSSATSVRYFNHQLGVTNTRPSLMLSVFLPLVITIGLIGGGGLYGYDYYQKSRPVLLSTDQPAEVVKVPKEDSEPISPKAYQAKEDEQLAKTIQKKIDSLPKNSEWSVSVRDLNSGRMANINADTSTRAASLYKLFLLSPLEKKISADNWKSSFGNQTINSCVTAMIKVSDNDCPQSLGSYINWKTVDLHNESIGFKNTKISKTGAQVTTTRDVSELMYRLQNSQILSDKARRLVFDSLYEQKYRSGIPAGCGSECLVGNKTGEIDNFKHDAAIIKHDSSQYVLVIMSTGASWQQVADVAHSIDDAMLP